MTRYPNGLSTPPRVSSPYGWRIHPITGARTFHYGTDSYGHPDGFNHAPEAGVVVFARYNGGNGNEVRIQGATRLWKLFHHARIDVAVGERVAEGDRTGPTGTTGASTGIHCHLECWAAASQDAFAYIAAALSGGGGGGGGSTPKGRKKDMPILYHRSGSSPTLYALAGSSPGTPANWRETTDYNGLAVPWAQRFGNSIELSPATFDDYKKAYLAPLNVAAGAASGGGNDSALVGVLQELLDATKANGARLDALPKIIDEYNDGKR